MRSEYTSSLVVEHVNKTKADMTYNFSNVSSKRLIKEGIKELSHHAGEKAFIDYTKAVKTPLTKEDNEQVQTVNNYNSDVKVSLKGDTLSVEKIVEVINDRKEKFKNGDVVYKDKEKLIFVGAVSTGYVAVESIFGGNLHLEALEKLISEFDYLELAKQEADQERKEMAKRIYDVYLKCIPFPAPINVEWDGFIHQDIYLKMVDEGVTIND